MRWLALLLVLLMCGAASAATSDFGYYKIITINQTMVNQSIGDGHYPLLVSSTDTDLRDRCQADGDDIVFYDADNTTLLAFEEELWNSTTGEQVHWVNVTDATNVSHIMMYYYDTDGVNLEDAAGVWDSNYVGIWHMTEANATDSTSNDNNGTATGSITVNSSGQINGFLDMFGADHRINMGSDGSLDNIEAQGGGGMTITSIVDLKSGYGESSFNMFLCKPGRETDAAGSWYFGIKNTGKLLFIKDYSTTSIRADGDSVLSISSPQHVSMTWNGGNESSQDIIIYINGDIDIHDVDQDGVGSTVSDAASNLLFWNNIYNNRAPNGSADETRISNKVRSHAYIKTEYNNSMHPELFISIGAEQSAGGDTTVPSVTNLAESTDPQGLGENVSISCNATDAVGVHTVLVGVTPPGGSETNYTMSNAAPVFSYNFADWSNGSYSYRVYANDSAGNMNGTETGTFELYSETYLHIKTLKDTYGANEYVNITDPEDLDELEARTSRKSVNTFYSGENASTYVWQPQMTVYEDTSTNHEVWYFTQSADDGVMSEAQWPLTEFPWLLWSADGKRMVFNANWDTSAFTRGANWPWFVVKADGTYLRPANDSASRCRQGIYSRYFKWSPSEPDTSYSVYGDDLCGITGLDDNMIYKNTFTDEGGSYAAYVDVIGGDTGTNLYETKDSIAGDGQYMSMSGVYGQEEPFYFVRLLPESEKGLKISWDLPHPSNPPYWGNTLDPDDPDYGDLHDSHLLGTGDPEGNYWFTWLHSGAGKARWRARIASVYANGTLDFNNAPIYIADSSSPYTWWGNTSEMDSSKEVQIYWNDDPPRPFSSLPTSLAHFDYGPWGRMMVAGSTANSPFGPSVTDLDTPSEITKWELGGGADFYCAWSAWSDWPIASNDNQIISFDYDTGNVDNEIIFQMNSVQQGSGWDYNGMSPDGTKAATITDWLNPTQAHGDLMIGVIYYPHPPEIIQTTAAGGTATVRFDWRLATTPRGYTARGWPNETADDAPPPRETEKFRLWRSPDNSTWTPIGTVNANVFDRYYFSNGTWYGNSYWEITDAPGDGTWYYAVTSVEWSGIESRTLSNIYSITVSGGSGTGSQNGAYPPNPGNMDNINTSDFYTSYNSDNTELIRYYNIYAEDGSSPSIDQTNRIGSFPKNTCSGGNCSWVDWLGNTSGTTQYIITAVDTQGQESTSLANVTATHKKSPAIADGQYTIEWSEVAAGGSAPVRSAGAPTGAQTAGTTSLNISLTTDMNATCKFENNTGGVAYDSMTYTFGSTGLLSHETTVTGLGDGNEYTYCVKCNSTAGNANTDDYNITFSISNVNNIMTTWDTSDGALKNASETIYFYVNYTNATGPINSSGDYVNISFADTNAGPFAGNISMVYNATTEWYDYNRTWATVGQYFYEVKAYEGSVLDQEEINYIDVDYQSRIYNKQTTNNITAYVLMQVEFYNTTTSSWVLDDVCYNSIHQITTETNLKLDDLFNGTWHTTDNTSFGDGTYRVYVAYTDPSGNVLENLDGTYMNDSYNFTLDTGVNTITLYANEYAVLNNWTADQTFSQIAANVSNDVVYSYYNSTSGLWEAYRAGYTYNANAIVPKNCSAFVFVNSQTTASATPNTGGITIQNAAWFYGYLPGSTAKTLTEIETAMDTDGLDVWSLYGWDNATQAYTATGSYSVSPNEGYAAYVNTTGEYTP